MLKNLKIGIKLNGTQISDFISLDIDLEERME